MEEVERTRRGSSRDPFHSVPRGTERGRRTEEELLRVVKASPGLSMYELGRRLGWRIGRVDGAVRRLLNSDKIVVRGVDRTGRNVNLVYPRRRAPVDLVEVPKRLLTAPNPAWRDEAFIYALSSSTIAISPEQIREWKDISCFRTSLKLLTNGNKVSLKIPENFVRFYDMENRHRIVSVSGNEILVTVSGDLIRSKKYPS